MISGVMIKTSEKMYANSGAFLIHAEQVLTENKSTTAGPRTRSWLDLEFFTPNTDRNLEKAAAKPSRFASSQAPRSTYTLYHCGIYVFQCNIQ